MKKREREGGRGRERNRRTVIKKVKDDKQERDILFDLSQVTYTQVSRKLGFHTPITSGIDYK